MRLLILLLVAFITQLFIIKIQCNFTQETFFRNYDSDERRLKNILLTGKGYSPENRPVKNTTESTVVSIILTVIQIMDLDEQNQIMICMAQLQFKWSDDFLIWDPKEYNNQTNIIVSSKDIWTPDIVLFNSADSIYSNNRDYYLINVNHNGQVTWQFPDLLKSYCRVDINYFPFDRQKCKIELQSWSRGKSEIIVKTNDEHAYSNYSFIQTEWQLLKITNITDEINGFVWLEYSLFLKRNYVFFVNSLIFPFSVLSGLTLFCFLLPPDSGEKITFIITILLALTVFLQTITQYTPKSSKNLPLIGIYFNLNLILVLISVVLTIIVLNFHFRGPKKQRVPKWMRKYIIGYIGRLFCFSKEVSNHKKLKTIDEEQDKLKNTPSSLQMCSNLDKMLIKIQKSLFSSRINDENLKNSILKEILECQRLLLIANLNSKEEKFTTISLTDIYNEWKILAMMIDRICFVFYLLTLIISTILFVLSEQQIIE